MKFISSLITVEDISRSRNFYENVLNLNVLHDFGENVTYEGDFAIHLKSHFQTLIKTDINNGKNNFELYFEYDNIVELVEKLRTHNIEFLHDIIEQPWKQRVIRFYDPDYNLIEVGESLDYLCYRLESENNTIQDIAKLTSMPEEYISEALARYKETVA